MYAIVKTGGKQYRVEPGQSLLVERLRADDGATVALEPLLYVDGSDVHDGEDLAKVKVSARVVGHERGPKLRVVKFKPKRGYKRRTGHRQELTRIEVTEIKLGAARRRAAATKEGAGEPTAKQPATKAGATEVTGKAPKSAATASKPRARTPAAEAQPAAEAGPTAKAKPAAARRPRQPKTATPAPESTLPEEEKNDGS